MIDQKCFVNVLSIVDWIMQTKCTSGKSEGGLTVNVTLHLYLKVYLLLVRLQGTINHLRWNSQKFLFGLFTEFGMEWCWQEFSSPWTWQIECSCSLYKASIIHFLFSKKTYFPSCTYLFLCTLLVFVYVFFYNQSLLITSTSANQFLGENFKDFSDTEVFWGEWVALLTQENNILVHWKITSLNIKITLALSVDKKRKGNLDGGRD